MSALRTIRYLEGMQGASADVLIITYTDLSIPPFLFLSGSPVCGDGGARALGGHSGMRFPTHANWYLGDTRLGDFLRESLETDLVTARQFS